MSARPSHTTLAGSVVVAGSVLIVLTVAERLGGLHSLESREAVTDFLSQPPGSGLGLDVPGALEVLRVALMVVAGCATAAAVLGFHALRGSRSARLGLTILAVPLFLTGLATGGFLTTLVAAAVTLLWINPSRAWFDGTLERDGHASGSAAPPRVPTPPPGLPPFPSGPPQASAPHPDWAAPPWPAPTSPAPTSPAPTSPATRRPDAVVWACAITWASCAVVVAGALASLTLLLTDSSFVWAEAQRQNPDLTTGSNVDRTDLIRATYLTLAVVAVWSLLAGVLALLVHRCSDGARVALIVSAGVAAVVSLIGAVVSSPLLLVPAAACLATLTLLVRPEVRAWCTRPRGDR